MTVSYKVIEYKKDDGPWEVYVSDKIHNSNSQPQVAQQTEDDDYTMPNLQAQPDPGNSSGWIAPILDVKMDASNSEAENTLLDSGNTNENPSICEPNDPALFINRRVTSDVINFLINRPCHPNTDYRFPQTSGGRSFLSDWFVSTQPNGYCNTRKWLSYSKSRDCAFCLTCLLFGGPSADSCWTVAGYQGWHSCHGVRGIERHESSSSHRQSEVVRYQWQNKCRVDRNLVARNTVAVEHNRRVVYVAVKAIKYLATEMTALLGHRSQDGKFLHLFREFAEFDPYAAGYLQSLNEVRERETKRKPEVNLLSPLNIRRLLVTMKTLVVRNICDEVSTQKSFSIINDGTQDVSKKDAQAVLLRYVSMQDGVVRPVERLVAVFTTGDSSGKGLCDKVVQIFSELSLDFEWLVGQSYDGAGNVSGKYCGLKARLLEHGDKALYVWCHAHRLNLVVEAVLQGSTAIRGTLGLLQELYNFFGGYKRHVAFAEAQQDAGHTVHTLKRVSDTTRSWRSAEDGINTVLECYSTVVNALEELGSVSGDASTVNQAAGLLHRLQEFEVIVCMFVLQSILRVTGPVSRLLQGVACDFAVAATLIEGCLSQFQEVRSSVDEHWQKIALMAKDFAVAHNISPEFASKRRRKVKRMPGEMAVDEPIHEREAAFKATVYIYALDTVLAQLQDRFSDANVSIMREMQYFSPKYLMSTSRDCEPTDIDCLCTFYKIESGIICRELSTFRPLYRQMHSLVSVSDLLAKQNRSRGVLFTTSIDNEGGGEELEEEELEEGTVQTDAMDSLNTWTDHSFIKPFRAVTELSGFPGLTWLYRILVTLAVTSSSAERAMSRLKIIESPA